MQGTVGRFTETEGKTGGEDNGTLQEQGETEEK